MAALPAELLDLLRCPLTRSGVVQAGEWVYGTDPSRPLKYPIRDGVPVMIPSAAVRVERAEYERAMTAAASG